jgi:chemotaxis protein MotB
MITLLLIVFILLFALSTINPKKLEQLHQGLLPSISAQVKTSAANGETLLPNLEGMTQEPTPVNTVNPQSGGSSTSSSTQTGGGVSSATANQTAGQIASQVSQALSARGLATSATVAVNERGVVVTILADQVFYASDSADPGPQGDQIIDTVGSVLTTIPNDVVVEGYTDNQPILGGPFASNNELSAMRAVNVEQRLISVDGVPPGRLAEEGYGATRPVASNATPAGQAQNRRIDIAILDLGQPTD